MALHHRHPAHPRRLGPFRVVLPRQPHHGPLLDSGGEAEGREARAGEPEWDRDEGLEKEPVYRGVAGREDLVVLPVCCCRVGSSLLLRFWILLIIVAVPGTYRVVLASSILCSSNPLASRHSKRRF